MIVNPPYGTDAYLAMRMPQSTRESLRPGRYVEVARLTPERMHNRVLRHFEDAILQDSIWIRIPYAICRQTAWGTDRGPSRGPKSGESLRDMMKDINRLIDSPPICLLAHGSLPDRLERVAVQFEADHPTLAASARRLVDLLARSVLTQPVQMTNRVPDGRCVRWSKVRGRTAREHGETAVAGHGHDDAAVALFFELNRLGHLLVHQHHHGDRPRVRLDDRCGT